MPSPIIHASETNPMESLKRFSKNSLLIIDDTPPFVNGAKHYFEDCGLRKIYSAFDGVEGIKIAQEKSPDLVLLDVELPHGMNGFEVLRTFHDLGLDLKVILITAHDTGVVGMRGAKLGITDFVSKSDFYDVADLKVKEALEFGHFIKDIHVTPVTWLNTNLDILQKCFADHPENDEIVAIINELREYARNEKTDTSGISSRVEFLRNAAAGASGNVAAHAVLQAIIETLKLL